MNKRLKKYLPYIIILTIVIIIVIFARLNITSPLSKKISLDWSRGKNLGKTISGIPVSIQIDNEDKNLYLIWSAKKADKRLLNFTKLNSKADILLQKFLDFNFVNPKNSQILLDSHKNLYLTWLDKYQDNTCLFHILLDSNGDKLTEPKLISIAESEVKNYKIGLNKGGNVEIFWEGEEKDQKVIYYTQLNSKGDITSENSLIISEGKSPSFQIDKLGNIHLIWLQSILGDRNDIYYSTFDVKKSKLEEKVKVGDFVISTGKVLSEPIIGLDNNYVYVFWSTEFRSGLAAGSAHISYLTFPINKPSFQSSKTVQLPFLSKTDSLQIGERKIDFTQEQKGKERGKVDSISLIPEDIFTGFPSTDYVSMPGVSGGQRSKLLLVCNLKVFEKNKQIIQLALVIYRDGEPLGYQLTNKTDHFSFSPKILIDKDNNIYLTWLDKLKVGQHKVFFAGTSSDIRKNLDFLTPIDIVIGITDTIFHLFGASIFILLVIPWGLVSLILIGIFYIVTGGEDSLNLGKTKIVLIVTIILYYLAKLLITPSYLLFPPFLDLIPAEFISIWIWTLPIIIFLVSLATLFIYLKKSEAKSLIVAFIIFIFTDGFLTIILYWSQII